jgi:phage head maturation protease
MSDGGKVYAAIFPLTLAPADVEQGAREAHYSFPYHRADFMDRVLMPGLFRNHDGEAQHLWQHDQWELPLGPIVAVDNDREDMLRVVARFSETPRSDEVLTLIRDGALRFNSIRWMPLREERGTQDGRTLSIQHEGILIDIGPVKAQRPIAPAKNAQER